MLNNLSLHSDADALVAQINAAVGSKVRVPESTTAKDGPKKKKKSARIKKTGATRPQAEIVTLADVAHEHRADNELGPLLKPPQLNIVKKAKSSSKTKQKTMLPVAEFASMISKLLDTSTKRRVREGIAHALVTAWMKQRLEPMQKSALVNYFVGIEERGEMPKSVSDRATTIKSLSRALTAVREKYL